MHYNNPLFKEEYLQGRECTIAYDMDSSNHVWLIENGAYIQFDLIESRYKDRGLEEVSLMKTKQRHLVKAEEKQKTQAEVDLAKAIGVIAESSAECLHPSIKGIRNNRKREQIRTHKNHVKEVESNV